MSEEHTMSTTEDSANEALALVCNLPRDSRVARRVDVFAALASAINAKILIDGVEFSFQNTDEAASSTFNLVLAERNCCPQFDYEIVFAPNHTPVQLRVKARGDLVKPLKNLYLGLAREAGVPIVDSAMDAVGDSM